MTEEDLNRLVFDNASDYEDEEEVDENEPEKMNEVDNKVDDSWDDKEKMEDFANKIQMKNKQREEESEAEKAKRDAKEEDEEEKIKAKKIKLVAPGLDLFTEKFLANFSAKNISLEKDFLYTQKREKLKELGIEEETISDLMDNRLTFLSYLMPEACSALISKEDDFEKICNFLFFCASSCLDQTEYELLTQALFDLLKNYGYVWKLSLRHIYTVLENLGFNSEILLDKDNIFLSEALTTRLGLVERMNAVAGRKDKKLWPPKSSSFVEARRRRGEDAPECIVNYNCYFIEGDPYIDPTEDQRLECIKNSVQLIFNLVIDMRDNTVFKSRGDDWLNKLTLIYLVGLLGTDKHLTKDAIVTSKIGVLLHEELDSFSPFAWTGASGSGGERFLEHSGNDKLRNACCDVSEVLSAIMNNVAEDNKVRTWGQSELPASKDFALLDHHHNMVRRLQLLPLSARGNQIRKNVAYLYLQHILITDLDEKDLEAKLSLYPRADIGDVMNLLEDSFIKTNFRTYGKNEYYVMMSMVRLIDMIVGSEREDFKPELVQKQKRMEEFLKEISKGIPNDHQDADPSFVREIVHSVVSRWSFMQKKHEDDSKSNKEGKKKKNARKS